MFEYRLQATGVSAMALAGLLMASTGHALTINYDYDRADAWQVCDTQLYTGKKPAAQACFSELLDSDDLLLRADASAALGDVRAANRLYRKAAANSTDPAIKTRWGQLYLNTHQISDALALFREALLYDKSFLPAQLGLAEALSMSFEGKARTDLKRITAEHPDNVRAMLLLAKIELELQNLVVARGLLNRALVEAEKQQLPLLEIYALHAGANLLEGLSRDTWTRKALAINPTYGDIYAIPAHYYIITYRYREAIELYQLAVNTETGLASAHRDLGINLLRVNNVFGARHHLQKAFDIDPFDAQTVNTLRLLDKLDGMRVTHLDVYASDAADKGDADKLPIGRVLLRLDREDADALEPYVLDLVTRAMRLFTERYQFQLRKPMIVELYHDHDDFGVRTVSTPGIGLLGVTFGYLTAMDSPRARATGDFHWGSTLWHEIAHVFTLEATGHRLPRWFSEGLSVYEEWTTGPLPNRELPLEVLEAIQNQKLLPIETLDQGFVRPAYAGQVQVSYMQAGLICDFIARRWGHEALVAMLQAFAEGQDTADALRLATGMAGEEFDDSFNQNLEVIYGDLVDSLGDYATVEQQLGSAVELDDWVSVAALARDMIRRYPQRVGKGNAYEVLAEAQRKLNENDGAMATLVSWHELGGHEPATLQLLAQQLRDSGRDAEAAAVLQSLNLVMPYASEEHRWLGEHYLENQQPGNAIREFDALLGLQPDDPAAAYLGKAQAARQLGDAVTARRQVIYALEHAPFYRSAQHLLLELNSGDRID